MNDTSVTEEVLHVGVFVLIAVAVVLAGWNEPLRYLFMNHQQIATEEQAMFAPPSEERQPWKNSLQGTALDRAPYRTFKDGTLEYSSNFDTRKMGPRTESEGKEHMYNRRR